AIDQPGERHLPRHDLDAEFAGASQLGVIVAHRRGHHHCAQVADVFRGMALRYRGTCGYEIRKGGVIIVAAADPDPAPERRECQRTHPRSPDAEEVDWSRVPGIEE